MLKIIVVSGQATVSGFVPTRDGLDNPIELDTFAALVRNVAETLAWQALGYPQTDFLEAGDPWRHLEERMPGDDYPPF